MRHNYQEINDDWQLAHLLHHEGKTIRCCAFKDVNLTAETELALQHEYVDCIFLGCTLPKGFKQRIRDSLVFPKMTETYDCFRSRLYSARSLYEGYRLGDPESYENCFDGIVYRNYLRDGKLNANIKETLARSLHDNSISTALHELLGNFDEKQVVGVMGGHDLLRSDPQFEQVARISKQLTEKGSIMISGGGPGAMEATHLGAWMAGRSEEDFKEALQMLCTAPSYKDRLWLDTAMQVTRRFPQRDFLSIGIPTWLYGHEPSTPLALCIAKYFDNSIREDGILRLAFGGIIFTPGSAGTLQEIFQDAVQNHYLSFGYASPMCFLGRRFWTEEVPVYPFLQDMVTRGRYRNLHLSLSDDSEDIVQQLIQFRENRQK